MLELLAKDGNVIVKEAVALEAAIEEGLLMDTAAGEDGVQATAEEATKSGEPINPTVVSADKKERPPSPLWC